MAARGGSDSAVPREIYGYRFVILAIAWTSYLIVYVARLSVGPLSPFLKESFNLSSTQVGSLMSATALAYAPTLIIAGWMVDRIGVRRMLAAGTFITSLCVALLFLSPSYGVMLAILSLSGLGTGCIFPSAVKAVMLWFPPRERATAIGFNQTAVNAGGIAGAALLPTIAVTMGWRYGFLLVGIAGLAICLICAILYRDPPRKVQINRTRDISITADASPSSTRLTLLLFKSRNIWMLGLAGLFLGIVEFSAMAHLVLYLKERLLFSAIAAGGLLALTEGAGALGKPASGLASDRLFGGRRKLAFFLMASAAAAVCLVLASLGSSLGWLLYPVLAVLGGVAIGWGGLYATMAGELGGKEMAGVASGASAALINLGVLVGPPLFGYIVDNTGSYETAWLAMALSSSVAAVFIWLIREPQKHG